VSKSLPPHPSLEALKKQAKQLVAAHKSGDAAACETLRQVKRFADASDAEILSAKVSLTAAQFALAMDYGFESWAALKAHVEAASGEKVMSATVFGCVTAEDGGQPIEDAEVRLQLKDGSEIPVAYACVRTASDGRYECTLKWTGADGPELWLQCKHAAYACTDGKETEPGEGPRRLLRMWDGRRHELNIELPPGFTLEVTVVDEDDASVEDAEVRVNAVGPMSTGQIGGSSLPDRDGYVGSPRTDAQGRCRVEGLPTDQPPGYTLNVDIDHPRFGVQQALAGLEDLPRDGWVVRADVQLKRRFTLTGRAVCEETNQPIEGARLFIATFRDDLADDQVWSPENSSCNVVFTGPDGRFEAPGLVGSPHRVFVTHDHCVEVEWIPAAIPQTEPLIIRLQRGRLITGCVLDQRGRPVGGAEVKAGSAEDSKAYSNETLTDEAGRFELGGLPAGQRLWVTAKKQDRNEGYGEVYGFQEIGPDEQEVVFDGREMVEVEGVVVDESGQPVPIRILCTIYGGTERGGAYLTRCAPLNDCGAFRALAPPDGSIAFRLDSREDEMLSPFHNIEHVTMCDGRADRPLRVVANPSKELALRLLDATTGVPVSQAELSVQPTGHYWNWCFREMPDEDGRAMFSKLPPCDVNVHIVAPGYEELWSGPIALPQEEEIVIRLTPETKTSAT